MHVTGQPRAWHQDDMIRHGRTTINNSIFPTTSSPLYTTLLDYYRCCYTTTGFLVQVKHLEGVGEELVELGHLGGDGEVDGAVGDLDDETTDDLGVDLV